MVGPQSRLSLRPISVQLQLKVDLLQISHPLLKEPTLNYWMHHLIQERYQETLGLLHHHHHQVMVEVQVVAEIVKNQL